MTGKEAFWMTAARMLGLIIFLMLLVLPARLLRVAFFPEGLSSNKVMIVVIFVIVGSTIVFFTYVLAPVYKWWEHYEEAHRAKIRHYRD